MNWILLSLGSGVFNAFWTSGIKKKVQVEGAVVFTASLRWGVAFLLVPFTWSQWHAFSWKWWAAGTFSGMLESLSVWTLARGARRDYYSTYALSNTTPFFTVLAAAWLLGETLTLPLALGSLFVVAGALWLFWRGHWSWWGFWTAVIGTGSGLASKWVIAESGWAPHACFAFFVGATASTVSGFWTGQIQASGLARNVHRNALLILLSGVATVCYYSALNLAPVGRVSALVRINMVVGFLLSIYLLGERDRIASRAVGALLILAGLVLVARMS